MQKKILYQNRQIYSLLKSRIHLLRRNDVETRFDTPDNELERPFSDGKNKKVIGLMKDELGGKIMKEFAALRAKIHSSLIDNYDTDENAKGTKSVSQNQSLNLKIIENV